MTIQEIKQRYELPDVLRSEGFEINRGGFCECVYHEERTASMRIYKHSFYSFCCGKHGDVIDFVRQVRGLSFQDACVYLSGEKVGAETRYQAAVTKIRRRDREKKRDELRLLLKAAGRAVSFWRRCMELADEMLEPMSDEWCDSWGKANRKYEYYCYVQDELLGEINRDHR